ncbi:class I SAM-dependent methyltransferase [Wenxinia saemankumensis]|uniref:Methyltransferase domain-containing protein n=1 Tax=Wenxinia saemankumensis TaxID=1447782 RepID=A0A1M6EM40_9RHOB|nr:class I SAM-dependent methyltransferase [Wenxinia saemankumensis]SHI86328.1 Methyltransferase domain-containing protein [Wenxinia saemankumensis]
MSDASLRIYAERAGQLGQGYDAVTAEDVLAPLVPVLPEPPASVLDVGPGTGRDLAWFAARGHDVTAAEPVAAFHDAIRDKVPGAALIPAGLPGLEGVDGPFGLILANLVWHHVAPGDRDAGMARMAGLLAPGGRLILCLRHGQVFPDSGVWATDTDEEAARAAAHGLREIRRAPAADRGPVGQDVTATWLTLEAPR